MRRRTLFPIVAAAALVLAAPARADKTFNDPAGDSGTAHDVTTVTVSNDATQVVVFFPVPESVAEPQAGGGPSLAADDRHRPQSVEG
jgi:hypothetical protein